MLGILFIIALSFALIYYWDLDKLILEWLIFYCIALALYVAENWKWILFVVIWILMWIFLIYSLDGNFKRN